MTVQTFTQPDSSTQTGSGYKNPIDRAVAVMAEVARAFAPHENNPLALTVVVDAGRGLVQGAIVGQNAQTVSGFVATGANQRIDRIVLDAITLAASRVAGAESASPVAPAIPGGKLPCAQVGPFTTSTTQITNSMITDERSWILDAATLGAVAVTGNQTIAGIKTFSGNLVAQALLDLSSAGAGQVKFPATQNPSADANTLDDYEEGTWTPVLTCSSPGDLNVAYTEQAGHYTKIGRLISIQFSVITSTFTFTTAGGNVRITSLPFTSASSAGSKVGVGDWRGVTKAGYTQINPHVGVNVTEIQFTASGSGVAGGPLTMADTPTGGAVVFAGAVQYMVG